MQVSDSGDVLYVLPSNFRQIIAGKSWLLRAEPFLQKVRDASAYLVRVTFGTALITSVILVWVTIVAILSSSGKDDDRRYVCTSTLATAKIMLPLHSMLWQDTCAQAYPCTARQNSWWDDDEDDLYEDGIYYTNDSHGDHNDDEYAVCPAVSCAGNALATPVH